MAFQIRKFNPEKHHRQSCRIRGYDFSQPGAYFITIKSYNNAKIFGKIPGKLMVLNDSGKIVYDEWVKTQIIRTNIRLGEFTIMPDHFHGILIVTKCLYDQFSENKPNRKIIQEPSNKMDDIVTTNQPGNKYYGGTSDDNRGHGGMLLRAPICIDQNQININHNRSNVNYSQYITRKSNMIYNGQQLFSFFWEPIISNFKRHVHGKSEQFGKPTKNTIPSIIRGFKSTVTKQINENNGTPGKEVWQRSYYLRIIETQNQWYKPQSKPGL
jgi:REP element-mobilizing transposase RayT